MLATGTRVHAAHKTLSGVGCGALLRHYMSEHGLEIATVCQATGIDTVWAEALVAGDLSPEECAPKMVEQFARAIDWPIELWPIKPWEKVCTIW